MPASPEFRYGIVFALTLAGVVWAILAPDGDWSKAVAFALQSAALVVIFATSRVRPAVRRARTTAGVVVGVVAIAAIASGVLPAWVGLLGGALLSLAIPL